ncbi:hypothetical protein ACFV7R_33660 [Streptomyces sp. NPDC059866]|uniref:hypothetical protein n=1 Tax=Streptomyces sp. NPDC059866 TaxID=3346978 RepID=UPI0036626DE1
MHTNHGSEKLPTKSVAGITVPVLPLDNYVPDTRQQNDIDQAIYALASKCMKPKGLSWPAPLPIIGTPHSPNERRYGISDEATAREYGYQLPPSKGVSREQALQREKSEQLRKSKMTRKAIAAYTGESSDGSKTDSEGGCRGRALAQLRLNQKTEGLSPADKSTLEAWESTNRDQHAIEANASWSKCMKRSGYDYPDPYAAAADPAWLPSGAPDYSKKPSPREVATALADIRCKREVNYLKTWQAVETKYQLGLIHTRSKSLNEARSAWQRSLRLAREVIANNYR